HGLVVGDVELHEPRSRPLRGGPAAFRVPASDVDGVARRDEPADGLETETLVRSGDQCGCHVPTMLRRRAAEKSPVFLGLPVPGSSGPAGAEWGYGDDRVRACRAAGTGPGVPGDSRAPH